jgi:single-strand DNA-binding protein
VSSLNAVTLVGNLGRKPELRYTPAQTPYAFLSVATDDVSKDGGEQVRERTEWHRIIVWGRTATVCAEYLDIGRQVLVQGRLRTRSWTDRQGVRRWSTEILGDRVMFLGGGTSHAGDSAEPPTSLPADDEPTEPGKEFQSADDEER